MAAASVLAGVLGGSAAGGLASEEAHPANSTDVASIPVTALNALLETAMGLDPNRKSSLAIV